jgi:hypothetical protein
MSPLLLAYAEEPAWTDPVSPDELVYCPRQNLTVLRATNEPAITLGSLETETVTKTFFENTDSDRSADPTSSSRLATTTDTRTRQEVSDTDAQHHGIRFLLATATLTFVQQENSDTD